MSTRQHFDEESDGVASAGSPAADNVKSNTPGVTQRHGGESTPFTNQQSFARTARESLRQDDYTSPLVATAVFPHPKHNSSSQQHPNGPVLVQAVSATNRQQQSLVERNNNMAVNQETINDGPTPQGRQEEEETPTRSENTAGNDSLAVAAPVISNNNADIEAKVRRGILQGAVQADEVSNDTRIEQGQRRLFFIIALALIVLVGIIVGVVVATTTTNQQPNNNNIGSSNSTTIVSFSPLTIQPTSATTMPSNPPTLSPVKEPFVAVTIVIQLDEFPKETGWSLRCNDVVYENVRERTYTVENQLVTQVLMVENGSVCRFRIIDSCTMTVGICCSNGEGFYQVYLGNNESIASSNLVGKGGVFVGQDTVIFTAMPPAPTISPAPSFVTFSPMPSVSLSPTMFPWIQLGQDINVGENETFMEARALGDSVSLSNDGMIVAVGAPGFAFGEFVQVSRRQTGTAAVLKYNSDTDDWELVGNMLQSSGFNDRFGQFVSLSGDGTILAVSARHGTPEGSYAMVFEYNSRDNEWNQMGQRIDQVNFAISLSNDGNILAVSNANQGVIRVLEYDPITTNWTRMGQDLSGATANRLLSVSLSSNGTVLAMGTRNDTNNIVRVMRYDTEGKDWFQLGQTITRGLVESGRSIAISSDGSILAVGARRRLLGNTNGTGRVFEYDSTSNSWVQIGQTIVGEFLNDETGWSVALSSDGEVLALGSRGDFESVNREGHVRIFKYNRAANRWLQVGQNINGRASGDRFGTAIALSRDGKILAVGTPWEDRRLSDLRLAGQVRLFRT